jgi:hypothetical protein
MSGTREAQSFIVSVYSQFAPYQENGSAEDARSAASSGSLGESAAIANHRPGRRAGARAFRCHRASPAAGYSRTPPARSPMASTTRLLICSPYPRLAAAPKDASGPAAFRDGTPSSRTWSM